MRNNKRGKSVRPLFPPYNKSPLNTLKYYRAMTLVELLIGISIVAILSATAAPSFTFWQAKTAADTTTQLLFEQLQATRELAITRGTAISLCGINTQGDCSQDNMVQLQIFIDTNNNKHKDAEETLLSLTQIPPNGSLKLNAHAVIRMKADGSSNTPASFIYCPAIPESSLARKITVSFSGRSYIAKTTPALSNNHCPNLEQ